MNVILKHAAPPPPPPPPEQIEITLDKSEANRLLTLLSQIDEDGLSQTSGPTHKLVRELWKRLSRVASHSYGNLFVNEKHPRLKTGV